VFITLGEKIHFRTMLQNKGVVSKMLHMLLDVFPDKIIRNHTSVCALKIQTICLKLSMNIFLRI
jgi:hypothetical protein